MTGERQLERRHRSPVHPVGALGSFVDGRKTQRSKRNCSPVPATSVRVPSDPLIVDHGFTHEEKEDYKGPYWVVKASKVEWSFPTP